MLVTTNYGLEKPEDVDGIDQVPFNNNADKVDELIKAINDTTVNGKKIATRTISISLSDLGGAPSAANGYVMLPAGASIKTISNWALASQKPSYNYNEIQNTPSIPTKTSQLENDEGYIKSFTESDPTVPSWAKAQNKPTYTIAEIEGLQAKITELENRLAALEGGTGA